MAKLIMQLIDYMNYSLYLQILSLYLKINMGCSKNSFLLLIINPSPLLKHLKISNNKANKFCIPLGLIFDPAPNVTPKHQHKQKQAGRNEQPRARRESIAKSPHPQQLRLKVDWSNVEPWRYLPLKVKTWSKSGELIEMNYTDQLYHSISAGTNSC